jgi:hypothetical protein
MSRLAVAVKSELRLLKKYYKEICYDSVTRQVEYMTLRHDSHQEETTSRYGAELRIYWIGSRLQLQKDGPPVSQLAGGQTTYHNNKTR